MGVFKERVEGYFAGSVSRKELGKWAERAYYDMLSGGYVERKKIVLYPFLRTISRFYVDEDDVKDQYPCSVEEVRAVQKILQGRKRYDFQIKVAIPERAYIVGKDNPCLDAEKRRIFYDAKEAVEEFMRTGNEEKIYGKIREILELSLSNDTLFDMLQYYIVRIGRTIFDVEREEIFPQMGLYMQKEEPNMRCGELLKYLECYVGTRNFSVLVSYQNGVPDMLLGR